MRYKKADILFAFDGKKMRCEEDSYYTIFPYNKRTLIYYKGAYDGESFYYYQLNSAGVNELIVPQGVITNKNKIYVRQCDPRYYGLTIQGIPISAFISNTNVSYLGDETINGVTTQKYLDKNNNTTVWLSPDLMYRAIKIELFAGLVKSVVYIEYMEKVDNVIFPKQISIEKYQVLNKNSLLKSKEKLIIQDKYEINTELPDSLFKINFPKGLKVLDQRFNKEYIIN
jgi:outer membrane lipoprotein-sorting protein